MNPIDYTGLIVGNKTERSYLSQNRQGRADAIEGWESAKTHMYPRRFADLFDKYGPMGVDLVQDDATDGLHIQVRVVRIEPGFQAYVMRKKRGGEHASRLLRRVQHARYNGDLSAAVTVTRPRGVSPCECRSPCYMARMKLWQQVEWKYRLPRPAVTAFARTFRVKLGKLATLEAIAPPLCRSQHWISFDPQTSAFWSMSSMVDHLVETYGLEVVMKDGALHNPGLELSWELPEKGNQAAKAMALLKRAEPRLEPRPYVKNGESDTLAWAVFSSLDWAELEAADLYAVRALFPLKGKVPKKPSLLKVPPPRRQRDPEHAELLAWVTANQEQVVPQLVGALDKLETAPPGSTDERDAASQIYRIGRRARR